MKHRWLEHLNGSGKDTSLQLLEPEKVTEKTPQLDDGDNDDFDDIIDDDDDDDDDEDDGDGEFYLKEKIAIAMDDDAVIGEGKIILRKDPNNKDRVLVIGFIEGMRDIMAHKDEMWEGDIILAPARRNGSSKTNLKKMSLSEMVAAGGLKRGNWKKKVDG